jgi:hypothetical protein
MPFGKKPDGAGGTIDFDAVYAEIIGPAIAVAELEPLRADEEQAGGLVHKAMFERLLLCEYAVADLTTANPNVFYELGVRHALRPYTTILIFAMGGRLPFDVAPQRALPYAISPAGTPADAEASRRALEKRLEQGRRASRPRHRRSRRRVCILEVERGDAADGGRARGRRPRVLAAVDRVQEARQAPDA